MQNHLNVFKMVTNDNVNVQNYSKMQTQKLHKPLHSIID